MTKARDLANASTALSAVSATELGYVDGVTSAIQTQIDAKAPSSTAVTLTGTQTLTNKTLTSPVISSVINNTLTSTTGDIIYASAANTPARLGIGSSAQVLTVASGIPSWATPATTTPTFAGCRIYCSGLISVPNNTATEITFDSELYDTDGYHSTSSNTARITVPAGKAGYYLITADTEWGSNTSGSREIFIRKNGSLTNGNNAYQTFSSGGFDVKCSHLIYLSVGDYVSLYAFQNSGGSLNIDITNQYQQFCAIYLGA